MIPEIRVDKWLWAVRVFKTRSLATAACRSGDVQINGQPAKASRQVQPGMIIVAKIGPLTRTMRIIGLIDRRIGAALVPQYMEDQTPASELAKPREKRFFQGIVRPKGSGRPSKKERRAIDRLAGEF